MSRFLDSNVTELDDWVVREESTTVPSQIFPVYLGSGACGMGIDGSGLQGLNHGVQHAFGAAEHAGDLYIARHGFVGDQLSPSNLLPMGYLDWSLEFRGRVINAANLVSEGSLWTRELRLDTATATTRILVAGALWLEINVWIPFSTSNPIIQIALQQRRLRESDLIEPESVSLSVEWHLTDRDARPLFRDVEQTPDGIRLFAEGHETYSLNVGVVSSFEGTPLLDGDLVRLTWEGAVGDDARHLTCAFQLDEAGLTIEGLTAARAAHELAWQTYYEQSASIEGIDTVERFMFHNSLYLIRSGIDPHKGVPISIPFSQPFKWRASTFWDSHFVMDGLMAVGDIDAAQAFVRYLRRIMRETGPPFSWMFLYDGTATIEPEFDSAPVVMAAHAMTAIKSYEYCRDDVFLADSVFPICRTVAAFAARNLYREIDGRWSLSAVQHDVIDDEATEVNATFTSVWFLVIMQKTVDYAKHLGVEAEDLARYHTILANYALEHSDVEYLHSVGTTAANLPTASWLPFLLYPTEGAPFIDSDLFARTRALYDFTDLYLRKQGDIQPWTCFVQAQSDLRRHAPDDAAKSFQKGMRQIYGPGLFAEIGPQQETVGLPPYFSAHGTFLAYLCYRLVSYSLWSHEIGLFLGLPPEDRYKEIGFRNIRTLGGITISGSYGPKSVRALVNGAVGGLRLVLPIPPEKEGVSRVAVNGIDHSARESEFRTLSIELPTGLHAATIDVG